MVVSMIAQKLDQKKEEEELENLKKKYNVG